MKHFSFIIIFHASFKYSFENKRAGYKPRIQNVKKRKAEYHNLRSRQNLKGMTRRKTKVIFNLSRLAVTTAAKAPLSPPAGCSRASPSSHREHTTLHTAPTAEHERGRRWRIWRRTAEGRRAAEDRRRPQRGREGRARGASLVGGAGGDP